MTKRGDIIELGRHRLMCGDASNLKDVEQLLDGASPRVMITDPPYIDNLSPPEDREPCLKRYGKHADWREVYEASPAEVAYVWGSGGPHAVLYFAALEATGFEVRHGIIWVKDRPIINPGKHAYQHKIGWYAVRKGAKAGWCGPRYISTVWEAPTVRRSERVHQHQKPVELWKIPLSVHEGDIYDPFAGSGTALIAAEILGRKCFTMEIEPECVDKIVERYNEGFQSDFHQEIPHES